MSDQKLISRHSDDEDDLEILRLEALKSLHYRKESVSSCHLPSSQKRNMSVPTAKYSHKRLLSGANYEPIKRNYYPQDQIMSRQQVKPVDNYENIFEKLDINEPYVPQQMCPGNSAGSLIVNNNGWNPAARSTTNGYSILYPAQNPKENLGLSVGNVQLSPRSLAFVAKNNDILMRRKVENTSPHYRSPSPFRPQVYMPVSPVYQTSPGRWSMTPPPKSKSRSPQSRNRWNYTQRRSDSRSPIIRRRTSSRSPPAIGPSSRHDSPHRYSSWSPKYPSNKRLRSRSPSVHMRNKTPHWRISRSPVRSQRHGEKSKSPINPIERKRNSPVPRRAHKSRVSPNNQNRSSSYGQDSGEVRHNHKQRSPRHVATSAAKSRSRSPSRKFRIVNDRNSLLPQTVRKGSPSSNSGRRRGDEFSTNGYRKGKKRSATPVSNKTKITRSRTPERIKKDENRSKRSERNDRKTEEGSTYSKTKRSNFSNIAQNFANGRHGENEATEKSHSGFEDSRKTEDKQKSTETTVELSSQNKSQTINEDSSKKSENLAEDGKEDNSSDNESVDDGIELFPSEESESENEGRFKLAAHTKERNEKVPAPSFTKLGETAVFDVAKDLKDVGHPNSSQKNNSDKHRSDRDRSDRRYESSRRRGDRLKKSEISRSRNERRRTNESSSGRRDYEESSRHNDKRRSERPMFKSTFQAIDNEAASKSSGKRGEEKDVNGKKGTVQHKKKHRTEDEQDSVEKEVVPEKLSSVVNSNSGGGSGSTRTSGKKPIHLRLGAMTNTFKAPKKTSLWNASQDKV